MYVRRVRAGEFIVVNPHLMKELVSRGKWNREVNIDSFLSYQH
jgi:hypothetical protein